MEKKVLDYGFVRLVDSMGSDLAIVRAARVSYAAEWRAGDDEGKDAKLIAYLLKNKHTSPFEAVSFTFEVCAPIFVFRQWHRHRTWSYNEVSARYTELPEVYYIPEVEQVTTQSTSNKQMRTETFNPEAASLRLDMLALATQAFHVYKSLLERGCPRELARTVLPLSTYSRMFATVDLHNLFHFLRLRLNPHAQYEIRVYAEAILEMVAVVCPVAAAAFRETL